MKRIVYILAALTLLCPALHAQTAAEGAEAASEPPWFSASMETSMGLFYGTMSEFVYEGDQVLSRLDWQEYFVPYAAVVLEFNVRNILFYFSFLSVLSSSGGLMEDFDYMDSGSAAHTHYSQHTAQFEKHLECNPAIGYLFTLGNFIIVPQAGITFRTRKWSAMDGYTQYTQTGQTWSESLPKTQLGGTIITYEESIWFPVVGLGAGYTFRDRFQVYLLGNYYPYLEVSTIDTHILRKTRYHDTMKGGMGFYAETLLTYYPKHSDKMSFIASIGWEGVYSNKGSISLGAVGADPSMAIGKNNYSKIESSIWWFTLGMVIYPEKLWQW
jgi:outer membrane protease